MSKLVIITGPPGAGKSTTCKTLMQNIEGVWAHVNNDDIRSLIKAGFVSANGERNEWNNEIKRQWNLGISVCCMLVKTYLDAGINCLLEFSEPPSEFEEWQKILKDIPYNLFILMPAESVAVERNRQRTGTALLTDSKISSEYQMFKAWNKYPGATVIDNNNLSAEATSKKIIELLT